MISESKQGENPLPSAGYDVTLSRAPTALDQLTWLLCFCLALSFITQQMSYLIAL